jgi:DNA-3-methyladenine glycosylase
VPRRKLLEREFFDRDPRIVARRLLGKILMRRQNGERISGRIVEAEAYLGADDAAAHAFSGKTQRNAVLFGPPGHAYVYFTYGVHYCMNVSCEPEGQAGCVLIRALEPLDGIEHMGAPAGCGPTAELSLPKLKMLTSGPGRLCRALGITRERDNAKDLLSRASDLQLLDDGFKTGRIIAAPRIGITKAAEAKLRFLLAGNPFVSGKRL